MEHLVYCDHASQVLDKLLSGQKTKIIRGATGRKLPYGRVKVDERLYFVENDQSSTIQAYGRVKSVFFSDPLSFEESKNVILSLQHELQLSDAQLKRWIGKKRLSIIEVTDVTQLDEPLIYDRQNNMDDWITVECIQDILVGSSTRYHSLRIR
ncbi:MAG TPA: hypothetical protein PLP48_05675 [Acholeplasmataceae bacterium]|mgnify:CR=1 FL=1|nr:hypothetical protein [Acholeplasmataceae bacterium]